MLQNTQVGAELEMPNQEANTLWKSDKQEISFARIRKFSAVFEKSVIPVLIHRQKPLQHRCLLALLKNRTKQCKTICKAITVQSHINVKKISPPANLSRVFDMIKLHWWNISALWVCACAFLSNFIVALVSVNHGREMIDFSDGNSILHQHQVVNLLALFKKKSAWIMFYCCSVELLLSDVMYYCCSFFQNCKDLYCLQSELCFHIFCLTVFPIP